jgi:hypothetical protein
MVGVGGGGGFTLDNHYCKNHALSFTFRNTEQPEAELNTFFVCLKSAFFIYIGNLKLDIFATDSDPRSSYLR